jgi:hypothetical protein
MNLPYRAIGWRSRIVSGLSSLGLSLGFEIEEVEKSGKELMGLTSHTDSITLKIERYEWRCEMGEKFLLVVCQAKNCEL